jgi:hypothetical protein
VLVARAHEMLQLIPAAAGVFGREMMRGAIAPGPTLGLRRGQQADRVDTEFDEVIEMANGIIEGGRQRRAGRQAFDMHLIDRKLVQPVWHRP